MSRTKADIMQGVVCDDSKFIDHNTVLYHQGEREVVRLHDTDIIVRENGRESYFTRGWNTVTTKDRLNKFNQHRLRFWSERGTLFVNNGEGWDKANSKPFKDGCSFYRGKLVGCARVAKTKKRLAMEKRINAYARGFTAALPVEQPSSGDCWGCCMKEVGTGKEAMGTSHLLSHMKEKYYVPSLLFNAMQQAGAGQVWYWAAFEQPQDPDRIKEEARVSVGNMLGMVRNGVEASVAVESEMQKHLDPFGLLDTRGRQQYAKWIRKYLTSRLIDNRD